MAFVYSAPVCSSAFTVTLPSSVCAHRAPLHGRRSPTRRSRGPCMDLPGTGIYDASVSPSDVRAVVFGATGYIGRYVALELIAQGYDVVIFTRERSGVGGKLTRDKLESDFSGSSSIHYGNVTSDDDLTTFYTAVSNMPPRKSTVVVSCLASRSGGVRDSNDIDYKATLSTLRIGREVARASHFILLSAICVQKPELEFQRAKLRFEKALQEQGDTDTTFSYSIVRPTAFFKSLAGQVDRLKKGRAFIMFGDGAMCKCNALSEKDLARFMVECARDESKRNAILPVGGPGGPVTPREQAELQFRIVGKKPKYVQLPIGIMDAAIGLLAGLARVFPGLEDAAEFGRIGRYYAVEDMVGPQYGQDTLEQFFEKAATDGGLEGQDLGDAAIF